MPQTKDKNSRKTTSTIEICPMCKKETLQPFVGFEAGFQFQCRNCGYVGPLRLLVDKP